MEYAVYFLRMIPQLFIISLVLAGQANAEPNIFLSVCKDGCDFQTIRRALESVKGQNETILIRDKIHTEADIRVDKNVTITGYDREATVVQAHEQPETAKARVFLIAENASVTIAGLTIRNGHVPNGPSGGGGVENYGKLLILNSRITQNIATHGAGVWNNGRLTILNTEITHNKTVSPPAAEIKDASGCLGAGAGVKNEKDGFLSIMDCLIDHNVSVNKGGGVFLSCESEAVISHTTIQNNEAAQDGGGIHIRGELTLNACRITQNRTLRKGGGIYNLGKLHFSNNTITDNINGGDCMTGEGGGIWGKGVIGVKQNNTVGDDKCTSP
jgi:hypothetical protein